MSLSQGTRLGPYEILAQIGAGGMGEVWKARDTRLGREVAIKVLPEAFAADAERLKRFEQEARTVAALSHPGVLAIFDVGTHNGLPYLVTELLEGETLRDRLSDGALLFGKALGIAIQVARGLAAAHAKGIIHRDLKPENVFLTSDGVKLLDFGLAKQAPAILQGGQGELATEDFRSGTLEGSILGTVGYMSPEQVRGETVDARSDLFSLGVVLYEMLSGKRPFRKETAVQTLCAILDEPAPELSPTLSVPPQLVRILARCLEKAQGQRFQAAKDLVFALEGVPHSLGSVPTVEEEKSIVVLPFENLSPDPDNAYFADGLTEEVIADLSMVRALRVISRTSAMHFKGTTMPLPEIAQMLKVHYVLEGSVRKAGNSLRITAQLIQAATDTHLWAEKFNGTFDDIFDVQEKVSRSIVDALKVKLTPAESERLQERPTHDPVAYDCYLKARAEVILMEGASMERAMALLEEGLRRSPDDPLLLASKAYVHWFRVNCGVGQEADLELAEASAREALQKAPRSSLAYTVLGLVEAMRPYGIAEAIRNLERAVKFGPNDMDSMAWLAVYDSVVGRTKASAEISGRMIMLNPLDWSSYMGLWFSTWMEGRFSEWLAVSDQVLSLSPENEGILATRMVNLIHLGRVDDVQALAVWVERLPDSLFKQHARLAWFAHQRDRKKAQGLFTPEFMQSSRRDWCFSLWAAEAFAQLGDLETALDWVENTIRLGFLNHHYLSELDGLLAPLRRHPRFLDLMETARERLKDFEVAS